MALGLLAVLAGCARIDTPEREGMLVVATVREPGAVHLEDGEPLDGFTADFLNAFAQKKLLPVRAVTVDGQDHLRQLLQTQRVHVGGFINPRPAPDGVIFTKPLSTIGLRLVQHADGHGPDALADLSGRTVHVVTGSAAAEALKALPAQQRPIVVELDGITQQDLLAQVAARTVALAATDELNLAIAANYMPDVQPGPALFGKREIALALPDTGNTALRDELDAFIAESTQNGFLQRLYDRYYGHVQRIGPEFAGHFLNDIRSVLPKYRADFQAAQVRTGLDWRLLAALAYQESKWDPLATSYTSVRGMMMLTEETADALGVDNRLDPAQSIRGGADYLRQLLDQLPDEIPMPDRLWFGLAAYNLGLGHLNGGRAIGLSLHKDTTSWYDMKSVLPLLVRPEYYQRLKSGKARGGEAVILVENVRNLYGVLTRLEPPYTVTLAKTGQKPPPAPGSARTAKAALGSGLRPGGQPPALRLDAPPK